MCQTCVNNGDLKQTTYDLLEAFAERFPGSRWGPGHVVIEDSNIDDDNIRICINRIDQVLSGDLESGEDWLVECKKRWSEDHDKIELRATRHFMAILLLIPEEDR